MLLDKNDKEVSIDEVANSLSVNYVSAKIVCDFLDIDTTSENLREVQDICFDLCNNGYAKYRIANTVRFGKQKRFARVWNEGSWLSI